MTTYMLHVQETEQKFPLPADIGADDDLVKRALASVVPYIDTAKLERAEKDDVVTITVTKSHAPKGAGDTGSLLAPLLQSLFHAKGDGHNPVIALFLEVERKKDHLHNLQPHEFLKLDQRITQALEVGSQTHDNLRTTILYLVESPAVPARIVPLGF
jgi:hypothetical protein